VDDEQTTEAAHSAVRLLKLSLVLITLGVVAFVATVFSGVGHLLFVSFGLLALGLVLGPLAYVDAINASGSSIDKKPTLEAFLRLPIKILGLLGLTLGLGMLVWIPYNVLVERSEHFTGGWHSLLAVGEWLSVVAIGWWWFRGAKGQRPNRD